MMLKMRMKDNNDDENYRRQRTINTKRTNPGNRIYIQTLISQIIDAKILYIFFSISFFL